MKKILCPTDFSETAHTAIAYAAKLAQAINGELTLLNVQSLFDYSPLELVRGKEVTLTGAGERLEAQSREVSKAFKISCYSVVEPGYHRLSTAIREVARNFDLIVMGSDGPDDLFQFFGGSNTYNAIVTSEIPLLLIPSGYVYNQITTIVYAFDYLHEKRLPLTDLIPFARPLNSQLTVLQVLEEGFNQDAERGLREEQAKITRFYKDDVTFSFDAIQSDEIAQAINSYVVRNEPDVLALCSLNRNFVNRLFHKSIIKNITGFCNYPVFVFHR